MLFSNNTILDAYANLFFQVNSGLLWDDLSCFNKKTFLTTKVNLKYFYCVKKKKKKKTKKYIKSKSNKIL